MSVKPVYNLYNLVDNYRISLVNEGKLTHISIKNYISDVRHFLGWLQGEHITDVATVSVEVASQYIESVKASESAKGTVKRRLSALRRFFTFCIDQGYTTHNPIKQLSQPISNSYASNDKSNQSSGMSSSIHHSSSKLHGDQRDILQQMAKNSDYKAIVPDIEEFFAFLNTEVTVRKPYE